MIFAVVDFGDRSGFRVMVLQMVSGFWCKYRFLCLTNQHCGVVLGERVGCDMSEW